MTNKEFYRELGNIDPKMIEAAAPAEGVQCKKRNGWKKWTSIAACFSLVLAAVICIFIAGQDGKIISKFKTNGMEDALYPVPLAGETVFFYEVEAARRAYVGKDVEFLVAFHVYREGDLLSGEALAAEYQRLADLGYKLYYVENHWTYRAGGTKEYIPIVVGLFTEEQLANFKANNAYGYSFYFASNGDGSAITVNRKKAITQFPSNVA